METTASTKPCLRTACDRCHELKERCRRETPAATCVRCKRLRITCSNVRPVRPAGRRLRQRRAVAALPPDELSHLEVDSSINLPPAMSNLLPEEKDLLSFLWGHPESLDQFVVCPSFQAEQHHALLSKLAVGLPLLKDAYLALAVTLQQLQSGNALGKWSDLRLAYISRALDVLRSLASSRAPRDTGLCYTLGGVLSLAIGSAIGVGIPDVCRSCLTVPSCPDGQAAPDAEQNSWESLLVLLEITDSLVYRRRPARRFPTLVAGVDRHLGLCLPLLPYYHDLCQISSAVLDAKDATVLDRVQNRLENIRQAVELWQPAQSDDLVDRFTSTDIVSLLAQAKVYRLGALLLSHRIQYPLGERDAEATAWSNELILELRIAKQVTKQTPRFVTLPFVIAAAEVQGGTQRIQALQHVDDFVDSHASFLQQAVRAFLLRVWHERDTKYINRWFDSVHKPCPVLGSINPTVFNQSEIKA